MNLDIHYRIDGRAFHTSLVITDEFLDNLPEDDDEYDEAVESRIKAYVLDEIVSKLTIAWETKDDESGTKWHSVIKN